MTRFERHDTRDARILDTGLPRKLALENRADLSWIGFALGCGHRLADKRIERFFLSRLIFGDDRGIRGEHVVDDSLNGADVGDLLQTLGGDDRIGVATIFAGFCAVALGVSLFASSGAAKLVEVAYYAVR